MIDTKLKILDTAERMFGEQGYDATSLRQIIAEAGVNLAAIHYHFGSKEQLLDELILRKATPVNEERVRRLERALVEAGAGPPPLDRVLEAFLIPMADAADRNPQFVRVMGRIHAEGLLQPVVQRNFQPVVSRFVEAMRRALPALSEVELSWRLHFMTGAMAHTMCVMPIFQPIAEGTPFRDRIERLVAFLIGGFGAPMRESCELEVHR